MKKMVINVIWLILLCNNFIPASFSNDNYINNIIGTWKNENNNLIFTISRLGFWYLKTQKNGKYYGLTGRFGYSPSSLILNITHIGLEEDAWLYARGRITLELNPIDDNYKDISIKFTELYFGYSYIDNFYDYFGFVANSSLVFHRHDYIPRITPQRNYSEKYDTAIINAIYSGDFNKVKKLLKLGANPNARDSEGRRALSFAAKRGDMQMVTLLLNSGADINSIDNKGNSAFMDAALSGQSHIIKLLIDKGADIHIKNTDGETALILACLKGNIEITKILLSNNSFVNVKNNDGETPLMYASERGSYEIVKLLLDRGAEVNIKKNDGMSALLLATEKGHREVVKLLLARGVNFSEKNADGQDALQIATEKRFTEIINILKNVQTDTNNVSSYYRNTDILETRASQEDVFSIDPYTKQKYYHGTYALFDGELKTAWVANKNRGVGAWINIILKDIKQVNKIGIRPGYDYVDPKFGDLFMVNNRIKKIKIEFYPTIFSQIGYNRVLNFDGTRGIKYFDFPNVKTKRIKITILEVYPGKKWADTCINEIEVLSN